MLVTCRQMQEAEARAFARGVSAEELMEEAGTGIARVILQFFPDPGCVVLFLGKGNNAGDALVAARHLLAAGWRIAARLCCRAGEMKQLPRKHLCDLHQQMIILPDDGEIPPHRGPLICLDGLLGIGSQGGMRHGLSRLAAEMNRLRQSHHAVTFAMDIPSGLDGSTGGPAADGVVADVTVCVAQCKAGLVKDSATSFVGRIALVPLRELHDCDGDASARLLEPRLLRDWWPRRSFDMHKGQAGRVGIIAGSKGFLGAAALACAGALRAGAGLVTLFARKDDYPLLASRVYPEVMVQPVNDFREVLDVRYDALVVGPGSGFAARDEIAEVILAAEAPAVLDADALSILADAGLEALHRVTSPRLLTPHPGEMKRLTKGRPQWDIEDRRRLAETFANEFPRHVLLLKGARTVIAGAGMETLFNSTGHPGMAVGGMGDVLSGVCGALIAQGHSLGHAAGLGAWLCGRSAELATLKQAQESLLPSDVADHLGGAIKDLVSGGF